MWSSQSTKYLSKGNKNIHHKKTYMQVFTATLIVNKIVSNLNGHW